jgi:hypothetical protein
MLRPGRKRLGAVTAVLAAVATVLGVGIWTRTAMAQPTAPAQRIAAPPVSAATGAGGGGGGVTITARDYSFDAPATMSTGAVTVTLRNEGAEQHHAQFVRLNDGVSIEQFGATLMQGPEAAFPLVTFAGGPGAIDPGGSAEVTLNLTAGQYMMLCFIESPDGVPHLAKGMIRPFQVAPPPSTAQPPRADGEVIMRDFSFDAPPVQAGQRTLRVVNQGPQPHEMAVIKADASLPDVIAALMNLEDEPPFPIASVGGFQAIDAGGSGWVTMNFTPGVYVLLCFVPDPATGLPHAALGMITPLVVQ